MSRSTKKGPAIDPKLMKKVDAVIRSKQKTVIKTWARWSTIRAPDGRAYYCGA